LVVRHQQPDVQLCSLRPRTSGAHAPKIGAARQSLGRPEPIVLRRRRTSTAASLSAASAPSCGAGSGPPAPTW
jgi:hypothetical protein